MAKLLAPSTVNAIRQYIDEGLPLEDLDISNVNRERVRICEQVYERLQQDPMLDINRCLMRTFGRSKEQVAMDKQVIEMFLEALDGMSKKLLAYRRNKLIEREARIAEQTGDWKPLDKAITHMEKLANEMNEEGEEDRTNFELPPVWVRLDELDETKHQSTDEEILALTHKYGGQIDPLMAMVNQKAESMKISEELGAKRKEGSAATESKDEDEEYHFEMPSQEDSDESLMDIEQRYED